MQSFSAHNSLRNLSPARIPIKEMRNILVWHGLQFSLCCFECAQKQLLLHASQHGHISISTCSWWPDLLGLGGGSWGCRLAALSLSSLVKKDFRVRGGWWEGERGSWRGWKEELLRSCILGQRSSQDASGTIVFPGKNQIFVINRQSLAPPHAPLKTTKPPRAMEDAGEMLSCCKIPTCPISPHWRKLHSPPKPLGCTENRPEK